MRLKVNDCYCGKFAMQGDHGGQELGFVGYTLVVSTVGPILLGLARVW